MTLFYMLYNLHHGVMFMGEFVCLFVADKSKSNKYNFLKNFMLKGSDKRNK